MGDEQLVESMQNKNLKDKIKITVLCLIFITITISFVFNGLPLSRLHKIHANYKTSNNLKRWAYLIGEENTQIALSPILTKPLPNWM